MPELVISYTYAFSLNLPDLCGCVRLCGHIHVLYKALDVCLSGQETLNTGINPPSTQPDTFEQSPQLSPRSLSTPGTPPPLPPPLSLDVEVTAPVGGEDSIPNVQSPSTFITEEEARMAVALTEYFQEQRRVCEQVSCFKYVSGFISGGGAGGAFAPHSWD